LKADLSKYIRVRKKIVIIHRHEYAMNKTISNLHTYQNKK